MDSLHKCWTKTTTSMILKTSVVLKTQDSKTQKYLFDHYLHFLKLHIINNYIKFLIYKVKETSIKTTCGWWNGSHLYGNENTCILLVRVYLTILNTWNILT